MLGICASRVILDHDFLTSSSLAYLFSRKLATLGWELKYLFLPLADRLYVLSVYSALLLAFRTAAAVSFMKI